MNYFIVVKVNILRVIMIVKNFIRFVMHQLTNIRIDLIEQRNVNLYYSNEKGVDITLG